MAPSSNFKIFILLNYSMQVDKCSNLVTLNLEGYDQLTDLALEYIVTGNEQGSGLKLLEEIVLSKKSFVTEVGLQVNNCFPIF